MEERERNLKQHLSNDMVGRYYLLEGGDDDGVIFRVNFLSIHTVNTENGKESFLNFGGPHYYPNGTMRGCTMGVSLASLRNYDEVPIDKLPRKLRQAEQVRELVEASKSLDGYYQDLVGIASRVFPGKPFERSLEVIAQAILDYHQMWHDVGNQDPIRQVEHFKGYQPLFLDEEHRQINPNLRPVDYLEVFKSFIERWAARKHNSDPMENWYQAQDEFAKMISSSVKPRE